MQEVQSTCTCMQRELSTSCTRELHIVIMSHAITSQQSLSKDGRACLVLGNKAVYQQMYVNGIEYFLVDMADC
jgi:hypothetical protein